MKNLLLTVSLLLAFLFSKAQTVDIPEVDINGFKGVKSILDKTTQEVIGYYTYYFSADGMKVTLMDTELTITNEVILELASGEIGEAVYNGSSLCFISTSYGTAYIYTVSLEGEVLGEKVMMYDHTGDALIFPSEIDSEFYLIISQKGAKKSAGYKVTKMNESLETTWEKEYMPPKGYLSVESAESGFDRVAVVQTVTMKKKGSKKGDTQLICFDAENGDELFITPLFDEVMTSKPSQMVIDEEGVITTAGEFYSGKGTNNVNSDGVFVSKIDASGEELLQNRMTWKEGIQKQMKRGKFSTMGTNKVLFHDLVRSEDGGYQLVGETFSKKITLGESNKLAMVAALAGQDALADGLSTVGAAVNLKNFIIAMSTGRYIGLAMVDHAPTIMTVQDMLVLDFDEELELQAVTKIDKPYTKVYAYPPHRYTAGLRLSKMVAAAGFFDYSFTKTNNDTGEQILVYSAMNSKIPHIGITNIEKGADVTPKKLEFDNLQQYATGAGKENEESEGEEDSKDSEESDNSLKISNGGVTKANEGKVLVYYVEKEKKATKGTLKMWFESLD
ncbi:DUF6770 family protein [Reichenbachiella versicolor]|uniref:DUF6770 family protein n=1 Tax=Reichenbachiella versicolor TaxID=1821036 RepID=UPI000D6DD240|nr:DUF6770 family protein [Reichenbachiella versicolor]